MVRYNEGLFSLIAKRDKVARAVLRDGRVVFPENILGFNRELLNRMEEGYDSFDELLRAMSEDMPETSVDYGLIEKPSDTHLKNGFSTLGAIRLSHGIRRNPKVVEAMQGKYMYTFDSLNQNLFRLNKMLQDELSHPEELFKYLTGEREIVEDLAEKVRTVGFGTLETGMDTQLTLSPMKGKTYSGPYTDFSAWLVGIGGFFPMPFERVRRFNIDLLSKVLAPHPEFGFGTQNDSWNLYRDNIMGQRSMDFGLIRKEGERFFLNLSTHVGTNGISKMRELTRYPLAPDFSGSLLTALEFYERVCQDESGPHVGIDVFSVNDRDYNKKRSNWYRDLLQRFNDMTTITSREGDKTLSLNKQSIDPSEEFLFQNVRHMNVNTQLRKLMSLARLIGGTKGSLTDVYPSIVPIIRNYQREAFELNLGVLVSDMAHTRDIFGWFPTSTYLTPSRYPSIAISRPYFSLGDRVMDISVCSRYNNPSARDKVRQSVKACFPEARLVYPLGV